MMPDGTPATPGGGVAGGGSSTSSSPSGSSYHVDRSAPGVFLLLISSHTDSPAAAALASASARVAAQMRDSGLLDAVASTLAAAGPVGCSDLPASRYRDAAPGCLHFIHAWKPLAQYTQTTLPPVVTSHAQRKALLRAYQHVYERLMTLTSPGHPGLRHFVASFPAFLQAQAQQAQGQQSSGSSGRQADATAKAGIIHVAGLHSTYGVLLASFDGTLGHAEVPGALERLAKALRAENDRLLLTHPGVVS